MSNLSTAVVDSLRQQIINGQLRPGDKLPAESALEQDFRVSRTVIREALSRLQAAGLVEKYRGKGTYVLTMPSNHPFVAPLHESHSHQDRLDLLDFRMGVEIEAAALAAQRRSTTQLTAMSNALTAFAGSRRKPSAAVAADFAFHRSIAIATNNRFYLDLIESLGTTMISMPQTRLLPADEEAQDVHYSRVLEEHRIIRDAITRQDQQSASAGMRIHLASSRVRMADPLLR